MQLESVLGVVSTATSACSASNDTKHFNLGGISPSLKFSYNTTQMGPKVRFYLDGVYFVQFILINLVDSRRGA